MDDGFDRTQATERHLEWLACAIALLGLAYLATCLAGRSASPWPLEWMEGASLAHAQRLLQGQPLYAAPSGEFIPFVYPPLAYLPMALCVRLWGPALWAARLPSLLALALCVWALGRAAQRLSGRAAGGLAAGLFAFGYGYTGGFFDLARVDALFMALCAWGVERSCARRHGASLACFALACFAKQHALLLLMAASLNAALALGRRASPALLGSWAALGGGVLALCLASDGWFWTYCVQVPARHGLEPRLLLSFVPVDLGLYLPVLCGLSLHWAWRGRASPALREVLLLLAAAVLASALGRAHPGGDDNVRLPAFALLCVTAAAGACELVLRSGRSGLLVVGLGLQIAMLVQAPSFYWPGARSAAYFTELRAELARCAGGGRAVALDHALFTQAPFVHTLALSDLRMNHDALGAQATRALLDALRGAGAPRALALSASFPELRALLEARYTPCARLPALRLPSGYALGPTFIYARRATP